MGIIEKAVIVTVKEIGGKSYWTILVMVHILVDSDRNDKVSCSLAETVDDKLCFVPGGEMTESKDHDAAPSGHLTRRDPRLCLANIPSEKHDPVGKIATFPVILGGSLTMGSAK